MGILDEDTADSVMTSLGFEEVPDDSGLQMFVEPSPVVTQKDEVVVEEQVPTEEETEIDAELTEAEERLAKAQLYKQFITGSIFDGNGPGVKEVSDEFRTFARRQLQILLGVVPKVDESHFSEDEVKILKVFIGRILQNPKLMEQPKPNQPQSKPSSKLSSPVVQQAASKPPAAPPKKPQLRSRQVPEEAVAPKPTITPASKPASKLVAQAQPPKQVKSSPTKPGSQSTTVPADEAVIEDGGTRYKIRYVDMPNIDEFGIMDGGMIRQLSDGGSCVLSNGIQVLKQDNKVSKILKTALAAYTPVPGRLPFPSISQMQQISLNNATQQVSHLPINQGKLSVDAILGRK